MSLIQLREKILFEVKYQVELRVASPVFVPFPLETGKGEELELIDIKAWVWEIQMWMPGCQTDTLAYNPRPELPLFDLCV